MQNVPGRLIALFTPSNLWSLLHDVVLPDLFVAGITFLVFFIVWKILQFILLKFLKRTSLDDTAKQLAQRVLKYTVLSMGIVVALLEFGVDSKAILGSLGIAGLTIGFAAKDMLSNMISGLFILWDRPFVIGDQIETSGFYGRVDSITMRTTRIVTPDGRMVAMPNSVIANSNVASYSNYSHLRIEIDVTIGVKENIGKVRKILLALIENDKRYMPDPPPEVVVQAINDYNIAVQLRAWLEDEKMHIPCRFELREKVLEALRAEGIDMPFETLMIVRNDKS